MMFVYFARALATEPAIKIGHTDCTYSRLYDLRHQIHCHVELLAELPGNRCLERRFHIKFLDHWLGGEWFQPADAIFEMIDIIKTGLFKAQMLPPKRKLPRELLWTPKPQFVRRSDTRWQRRAA